MSNLFKKQIGSRLESINSLKKKMQDTSNGKSNYKEDERQWKPELDKVGNGSAIIRFLPGQENDGAPYASIYNHGFQVNGKWFIENCPTSINTECPVCKANNELWNTGREEDKAIVRNRKRKQSFISNILVLKDAKHPENEGKIFLYRYGKKIFEKIKDLLAPPEAFADMNPVEAWHPFEGANFKLRVTKQDGFPNFDKSSFDAPSPLFGGDEDKIEALASKVYSLSELVAPTQFKSYEELEKNLARVLGNGNSTTDRGGGGNATSAKTSTPFDEIEEVEYPVKVASQSARSQPTAKPRSAPIAVAAGAGGESVDDDDDYFAKLAQDSED